MSKFLYKVFFHPKSWKFLKSTLWAENPPKSSDELMSVLSCFHQLNVCQVAFLCMCMSAFWARPTDYWGRASASGSMLKDWLSSQWCQWRLTWRRNPLHCRPPNQTQTAACLCWKSACNAWHWADPRPRPAQCMRNGGRTRGMLGNEIRLDLGLDHGNLSRFIDVKTEFGITVSLSSADIIYFF